MTRVLVTGGAGFVGSHVVDALVAGGHEAVVLDALDPSAHDGPPAYRNPDAEYRWGRVEDPDAWTACLDGVEAVSHQAARVGLGVDMSDAPCYASSNDLGTAVMLAALHESGFRGRIVLAGSMVVYGEGGYWCPVHGRVPAPAREESALRAGRFEPCCPGCGHQLEPVPVDEDAPLDPRNVYAATKVHQEHLCSAYSRATGVPVTVLRYHNVYGPRMPNDTPYAGVASIFRSALEAGRPPLVYEDGNQIRDFVHVRDVAAANILALTWAAPVPGAFNVASGEPRTVGEMAAAIHASFGPGAPAPVVTGGYRLGDVRHVFASPARAAAVLGFRASVPFDDGMAAFADDPLRAPASAERP